MSIPAARVGIAVHLPASQRTCPRCGIRRSVNRGNRGRLCGDCHDTCVTLGELWRWER